MKKMIFSMMLIASTMMTGCSTEDPFSENSDNWLNGGSAYTGW